MSSEKIVWCTYLFPNGMVATVGFDGEQIPELQGEYSRKLHIKIWEHSDDRTEWNGFPSLIIDCNPKQL